MTARELIIKLSSLKEELLDKEVIIQYPNGNNGPCGIKFILVDPYNLDKTKENVKQIILT
jgi:hypothetical protein